MKKILLLLMAIMSVIACRKNEAPFYPKQVGEINPPEWLHGQWESIDGNTDLSLIVSKNEIIKDGVSQKDVIQGREIIFEDIFKYSKDQYIYVYELKKPFDIAVKYNLVTTTTIYEEDGKTIAKDKNNKDRVEQKKKEVKSLYSAKFFKSHYKKVKNNVEFKAILVDDALGENAIVYAENQILPKKEENIKEKEVKLKKVTTQEITDFTYESIRGITEQDFQKLVKTQVYKKK